MERLLSLKKSEEDKTAFVNRKHTVRRIGREGERERERERGKREGGGGRWGPTYSGQSEIQGLGETDI